MKKIKNDGALFRNIGASSHSDYERDKYDFYATDPSAILLLHTHGLLDDSPYWETACGNGMMSKELLRLGYDVVSSDKYDHGYGDGGVDFFKCNKVFEGNLITNPPYRHINRWIEHSLNLASNKVYIFCRIPTIETIGRYNKIFKHTPPKFICPFVKRVNCYRNGITKNYSSAVCYAWFIWDNKDSSKETKVKWLI